MIAAIAAIAAVMMIISSSGLSARPCRTRELDSDTMLLHGVETAHNWAEEAPPNFDYESHSQTSETRHRNKSPVSSVSGSNSRVLTGRTNEAGEDSSHNIQHKQQHISNRNTSTL